MKIRLKDYKGGLLGRKPKALTPSERNISAAIEDILNARRIYNDRLNSGQVEVVKKFKDPITGNWKQSATHWVRLCKKGTPDRYAILPTKGRYGVLLFIEVKAKDGRLSEDQIARQAELKASGAVVINAYSVEDFIEKLDKVIETAG